MGRAGIEPATLCLKDPPGAMRNPTTDAGLRRMYPRRLARYSPAASIRFSGFRDSTDTTTGTSDGLRVGRARTRIGRGRESCWCPSRVLHGTLLVDERGDLRGRGGPGGR